MHTEVTAQIARALIAVATLAGCNQSPGSRQGVPAPSASTITIVAGLGYCEDRKACEQECEAGTSDRCRRLGVNYEFGHGVEVDGARATALYEQSCKMKNTDGCVAAGRMYEFHHGVLKDDVKAASYYSRACELGDPTGCANFGIMLESGHGTTKDRVRAKELYDRACARGASLACAHARALEARPDAAVDVP